MRYVLFSIIMCSIVFSMIGIIPVWILVFVVAFTGFVVVWHFTGEFQNIEKSKDVSGKIAINFEGESKTLVISPKIKDIHSYWGS